MHVMYFMCVRPTQVLYTYVQFGQKYAMRAAQLRKKKRFKYNNYIEIAIAAAAPRSIVTRAFKSIL